jgi:tetratricopeptide (TPR) repeat protein
MPSILDGIKTEAEMKRLHAQASAVLGNYVAAGKLTPRAQSILDAMGEGLSLAEVMGITTQEREALLVHGLRQMQSGDAAGAQETLLTFYHLDPLDPRAAYALAANFQAQEDYLTAGRLYLTFLALDATNPEGYLRLGECFMGNREDDQASAYFEAAKVQAAGTPAQGAVEAHADAMRAILATRMAA